MSHQRVLTLYPYLLDGTCWVFDDERTGLKEEAFVLGMTEMISRAVDGKGVHDAAKGFALSFSDKPFDGHDFVVVETEDAATVRAKLPANFVERRFKFRSGMEECTVFFSPRILSQSWHDTP
jgi:hypothetical protein